MSKLNKKIEDIVNKNKSKLILKTHEELVEMNMKLLKDNMKMIANGWSVACYIGLGFLIYAAFFVSHNIMHLF